MPGQVRPVDTAALSRIRRRLHEAAVAPWLHTEVARRMAERLSLMKARPEVVIDWQAHVGGGQVPLRAAYPRARHVPVETEGVPGSSSEPSRGAWRWLLWRWRPAPGQTARVQGEGSGREGAISPQAMESGQAGLVWANMVLHAHPDPLALMAAWHRALAVEGCLMFSTFGPGTLPELRSLYAAQAWGSPLAPIVDMHDLGDMLLESGFTDPVMDQEQIVLTWPDAEAALRELRGLGGNADLERHPGLRTARWRERLLAALADRARSRPDRRVALTFEIAYGHAFKPTPRIALAAESHVGLEQMRQMLAARAHPRDETPLSTLRSQPSKRPEGS